MRKPNSLIFLLLVTVVPAASQPAGAIEGVVTLAGSGEAMHNAKILVPQLGRTAETDQQGRYRVDSLPPGAYDIIARAPALGDERKRVQIGDGETVIADFALKLAAVREAITVTASGHEQTSLETFESSISLESTELTTRSAPSLGDVLEGQAGIAKRSYGAGNTRPVIRGFDGDRVLIMQDSLPTGTISSQSADNAEPIDVTTMDRVEILRGPATLLYGSNAIGGVVNAISRHDFIHSEPHPGLTGFLTGAGGTANEQAGGSGGFDYGFGKWLIWASGGAQRTGDYSTPVGTVLNSRTRTSSAEVGFGRYTPRRFWTLNYAYTNANYGIPVGTEAPQTAERTILTPQRNNLRFNGGLKNIGGFVDRFQLSAIYSDYQHQELNDGEVSTQLFNKQFVYRAVFDQKKRGRLSGTFGMSGMERRFRSVGEESLAPPTRQNTLSAFGVEASDFEKVRFQLGGRVERNAYDPAALKKRSFTGASMSAGVAVPLGAATTAVLNFTLSHRAPALEELYFFGPHAGNLTFEIGNANLAMERNTGLDASLRRQSARLRFEGNVFYYRISDFVYLAPTGRIREGFVEANYAQADTRYRGAEARLDAALRPNLWLNLSIDSVNARLRQTNMPLPRIPPIRGRIGFDVRLDRLSVKPELVLARPQNSVFVTETRTAGYAVANLNSTYTIAGAHSVQIFYFTLFNATDRLYRNHLSFIKNIAPEIGRGFRIGYTIRFF